MVDYVDGKDFVDKKAVLCNLPRAGPSRHPPRNHHYGSSGSLSSTNQRVPNSYHIDLYFFKKTKTSFFLQGIVTSLGRPIHRENAAEDFLGAWDSCPGTYEQTLLNPVCIGLSRTVSSTGSSHTSAPDTACLSIPDILTPIRAPRRLIRDSLG